MSLLGLKTAVLLCGLLLVTSLTQAATTKNPANSFTTAVPAAYMDDPRRNEWQMPTAVLERLPLKPGAVVADLGAGTGYFTLPLAQKSGNSGVVYAIDIDPAMIQTISDRANAAGFTNIKPILVTTSAFPTLPTPLDLLFMCDTYLFIDNRVSYLAQARNNLKDTGRLAIISFNATAEISGAPPPHMIIAKAVIIAEAEQAGFSLDADHPVLPFQDFLLFRKR